MSSVAASEEEKAKGRRQQTMLAAAVAHPVRVKCFAILAERVASPTQIAREIGVPVNRLAYHIHALLDAELIVQVDERQVRGAVEHFYKSVYLPLLTTDEEAKRTPAERRKFIENVLSFYAANASHSLDSDTLLARGDHHLTRSAMDVDWQGWEKQRRRSWSSSTRWRRSNGGRRIDLRNRPMTRKRGSRCGYSASCHSSRCHRSSPKFVPRASRSPRIIRRAVPLVRQRS